MPIKPSSVYTQFYSSSHFSLAMRQVKKNTKFIMNLKSDIISTHDLPDTQSILKQILPSIFKSTCYNEYKYTFKKEVTKTEIGHLFEHILIEYLCLYKISEGCEEAEYSGLTKWNWKLHPKGSFHITVSAGRDDVVILSSALEKSIMLINRILISVLETPRVNIPFIPALGKDSHTTSLRIVLPEIS